jgi:hypothetical protein
VIYGAGLHTSRDVSCTAEALSPEMIRNELLHVQQSILIHKKDGRRYITPSQPALHAQKIYPVISKKNSALHPFLIK